MSLVGELEAVIEVKASAERIHQVFSCRPHIVTSIGHPSVQSCELLEGEWGKPGYVICWKFCGTDTDDSPRVAKEKVEVIDNEEFITTYKLIEGRSLEKYKSFHSTARVAQNPISHELGSLVHWTYKYEKRNEYVPDLETERLQLVISNVKEIDAYLLAQTK